jgi:PAS domain-containing protein
MPWGISIHRPVLTLVATPSTPEPEWSWFCGRCAAPAPGSQAPAPNARVCPSCGFGLLLETRRDIVPNNRDAFLVADNALLVQAVSRKAESLLGVTEALAINRPLSHLLVPADAEAQTPARFAAMIAATVAADETAESIVRPWNTFGVRMRVRVARCGPPRAALLVFQPPRPRLRAV